MNSAAEVRREKTKKGVILRKISFAAGNFITTFKCQYA